MNANDVIESYVRDVAGRLPRNRRDDVAFELRALLADELAARAEAAGRAPDKAMVMDLLKGFGRPAEAARRYHERPALIDAADTHHFLIWAIGGAVAIVVLTALGGEETIGSDLFLKWLGVLVIVFAVAALYRRHNPNHFGWRPRRDPERISWPTALLATIATLAFPVFMYAAPQTFAELLFFGVVPTDGLALTQAFLDSEQRVATLVLLVASAMIYLTALPQGRFPTWARWVSILITAGIGVMGIVHATPMTSLDGQTFWVFESSIANSTASPFFLLVAAIDLLSALYQLYREWARISPAPRLTAHPAP